MSRTLLVRFVFVFFACSISAKFLPQTFVDEDTPNDISERFGFGFNIFRPLPTISAQDLLDYQQFGAAPGCPGADNQSQLAFGICQYPCQTPDDCRRRSPRWQCCLCRGFGAAEVTFNCVAIREVNVANP